MDDKTIQSLRDAIAVSPENVPLRRHLAATLLAMGRVDEAIQQYQQALAINTQDMLTKLGLAESHHAAGNNSIASIIVEELERKPDAPPGIHLLHSRLLAESDPDRAARAYRRAVEADASLADERLAASLGLDPRTGRDKDAKELFEDDEQGRLRVGAQPQGPGAEGFTFERPKVTFADVGGMEAVKEEIRMKIIHPLKHPDLYKLYGKAIGGGILLYGPPGCGKTFLARATAGEIQSNFLPIGIHDVLDMWLGNSEKNLHSLFQAARGQAPCVVFFDEIDALGASRADLRTSAGKQVINQFLSELDGVQSSNDGLLVLGATNAPWHLDGAFRRPGRFDRILFVPPPDAAARAEILGLLLRGKPTADIDLAGVAAKTDHYSGADLKAVIDVAVEGKLRQAMQAGKPMPITTKDLLTAAKSHRPTTREWFATARNYAMYSNESGLYDDILKYLK